MYKLMKNQLDQWEREQFARLNRIKPEQVSADLMMVEGVTGLIITTEKVVGGVYDNGTHYIVPRYSRFDRINKETWEVEMDV